MRTRTVAMAIAAIAIATPFLIGMGIIAALAQCPDMPPMREDNNGRRLLYLECQSVTLLTKLGNPLTISDPAGIELYVVVEPLPETMVPE